MEGHVLQVIYIPTWTRVEKVDHLVAKKIVDAALALYVNLRCIDYLAEEDLRSYRLALIDEDNVSPLRASPGPAIAKPPTAEVAPSVSPAAALSSSTMVPPWATTEVMVAASTPMSPLAGGFTPTS